MTSTFRNFLAFFSGNARRIVLAALLVGLLAVAALLAWRLGLRLDFGSEPSPLAERTRAVATFARLLELDLEIAALGHDLAAGRDETRLLQAAVRLERRLDALDVAGSDALLPDFERLRMQIDRDPREAGDIIASLRRDLFGLRPATPGAP